MSFPFDSTGVDPEAKSYKTLPEGQVFEFKIMEAEEMRSKKTGYPMVKLRAEVVNDAEWAGVGVFHYVVFIPKGLPGEGINVHFRKSIGVPYGGNDVVDAGEWVGKKFRATTKVDEYEGKKNSKISAVESREDAKDEAEIPF